MYRLQVWFCKRWKWGVAEYETLEAASERVRELKKSGIKARVKKSEELFS